MDLKEIERFIAIAFDGHDVYFEGRDVKADLIEDLTDLVSRMINATVESATDRTAVKRCTSESCEREAAKPYAAKNWCCIACARTAGSHTVHCTKRAQAIV